MQSEFTVAQLIQKQREGNDVVPVFGLRPTDKNGDTKSVYHLARNKFDPKPWTDGCFRYSTWELTIEPHTTTDGERAELRHTLDDMDRAFASLVGGLTAV